MSTQSLSVLPMEIGSINLHILLFLLFLWNGASIVADSAFVASMKVTSLSSLKRFSLGSITVKDTSIILHFALRFDRGVVHNTL